MGTTQPTGSQLKDLMNSTDDRPFVMINLLKFKKATDSGEPGKAAYQRYEKNVFPLLLEAGGRPLWIGAVGEVFIGTPDDAWDQVMLIEYPSRAAFLKMISRPEYQKVHHDREIALENSVLLAAGTVMKAGI